MQYEERKTMELQKFLKHPNMHMPLFILASLNLFIFFNNNTYKLFIVDMLSKHGSSE